MDARLYLRVSTEEQTESGYSLAAQQERLEAFCRSQGWRVAGVYVDEGASGKDLNRPAFKRLMNEIQHGDVVLVYKLDRLTRSVRDLDDLLKEFDKRGILFRSATEIFDTTSATGRLFIRIVAELAQWERETIAERATMGKYKRASEGEWGGGPAPFGYKTEQSDKVKNGRVLLRLVPDPQTKHIVQMIFERYVAGYGIRKIAKWLNEELGCRTTSGGLWHRVTLVRLLTNPIYCGDIEYGRRNGKRIRVRGTHEPIISRELFDHVQELLERRKKEFPRQATGQYPLAGVARCGVCGGGLSGTKRHGYRIYRCQEYVVNGRCSFSSVRADDAEQALIDELTNRLETPEAAQAFLDEYEQSLADRTGATQAEIERLKADLTEAESAISRWKRLFERGAIDDDEYLAEVKPHKERVTAIKQRLEEIESQQVVLPTLDDLRSSMLGLRDNWPHLTPEERKALLSHAVRAYHLCIYLHPECAIRIVPSID